MNTKIDTTVSQHLKLVSGISAIFVVFIHATTFKYDASIQWNSVVGRVQGLFSHNIFHVALPIFFLNSAFFFFLNAKTFKEVCVRVRRRGITLLMPYLAWSGSWIFLGLCFGFLPDSSGTGLLLSWVLDPPPGQLWFLRDLICLVILAPLIFFLPTRVLALLSLLTWACWLWSQTIVALDGRSSWYDVISNEALSWFLIGALGARFSSQVFAWIKKGLPIYLLLITLGIWIFGVWVPLPMQIEHGLAVTAGALFLLGTAPHLRAVSSSHWAKILASYGFLIYVGHHPAISLLQEQLIYVISGSQIWHFAVYFFVPILIIIFLICAFSILSRIAPKIVYIANGGRAVTGLCRMDKRGIV